VSLVGRSRGGIIAREATRMEPHSVRTVVTLGSPFAVPAATNVVSSWRSITGERFTAPSPEQTRRLADPLPVPSTSIFSRSDGVVAWQASVMDEHPLGENIEVQTSHTGMALHPAVRYAVFDRLAQPEGQ